MQSYEEAILYCNLVHVFLLCSNALCRSFLFSMKKWNHADLFFTDTTCQWIFCILFNMVTWIYVPDKNTTPGTCVSWQEQNLDRKTQLTIMTKTQLHVSGSTPFNGRTDLYRLQQTSTLKATQFLLVNLDSFCICLASLPRTVNKLECSCWKSLAHGLKTKQASANVCHTWLWMMRNLCWQHLIVKTKPGMVPLCLKLPTINLLSGSLVMRRTRGWFGTGSRSLPRCCKVGKHNYSCNIVTGARQVTLRKHCKFCMQAVRALTANVNVNLCTFMEIQELYLHWSTSSSQYNFLSGRKAWKLIRSYSMCSNSLK